MKLCVDLFLSTNYFYFDQTNKKVLILYGQFVSSDTHEKQNYFESSVDFRKGTFSTDRVYE